MNTDSTLDFEQLQLLVDNTPHVPLTYTIYDHSSYSGPYHPGNICVNDPDEQSSRWSSNSHDQSQYITIQLEEPTVVCEILFGKFHRSHVCNLKEFKIYGGLEPDDMKELLHKGLIDDNKPELFTLRYTYDDLIFPIQYLKIKPMATFGANFNYSIWYVEVRGIKNKEVLNKVYDAYNKYKEKETIRLCLKHFRQKNMMGLYNMLQEETKVQLEHPLVHELHKSVVIDGDFEKAETLILKAHEEMSIFKSYVEQAKYRSNWQYLTATSDDGDAPCARGGHQLCIDTEDDVIYLFGGWDGTRELADFWCYHIKTQRWKLISSDTSQQGGPTARSCHTICFDPKKKCIYVLGRYVETARSTPSNALGTHPSASAGGTADNKEAKVGCNSEFFQYFTELDRWQKLSDDTQMVGGPPLLCDHQMCVDPVGRNLYVFGGRVISTEAVCNYGGFYAYDMDKGQWKVIRYDINNVQQQLPSTTQPTTTAINTATFTTATNTQSPNPTPSTLLSVNETPNNTNNSASTLEPYGRRRSSNGSYVIPSPSQSTAIKSRTGHTMTLDHKSRCIYIFGGQRGPKEYLTELLCYDIEQDKLYEIAQDFARQFGTNSGYTQRACIDIDRQEIYVASGFLKNKPSHTVSNSFWVYHIQSNQWEKVYECERTAAAGTMPSVITATKPKKETSYSHNSSNGRSPTITVESGINISNRQPQQSHNNNRAKEVDESRSITGPCPRYTFQLVYHPQLKTHFLFGGHPGEPQKPAQRLDDFWELKLTKPDTAQVLRHCLYLLRTRNLEELYQRSITNDDKKRSGTNVAARTTALFRMHDAVDYLRNHIATIVDYDNEDELRHFKKLCTNLCMSNSSNSTVEPTSTTTLSMEDGLSKSSSGDGNYMARTFVFQSLLKFFPKNMKEPEGTLLEAVKIG